MDILITCLLLIILNYLFYKDFKKDKKHRVEKILCNLHGAIFIVLVCYLIINVLVMIFA